MSFETGRFAPAVTRNDRFGELKARQSQIGAELDEISTRLKRFFEKTGERAVAGECDRVKANRSESWRIEDEEELCEVLEPVGLWDNVLRVGWREKAALPEDTDLSEEFRRACQELAERHVTWRLWTAPAESQNNDANRESPQ